MVESLGYMVGRVRLHGGDCCVGSVGLYGGECCITLQMLDYIEWSIGLPGDSAVREWLFNNGLGRVGEHLSLLLLNIFSIIFIFLSPMETFITVQVSRSSP